MKLRYGVYDAGTVFSVEISPKADVEEMKEKIYDTEMFAHKSNSRFFPND